MDAVENGPSASIPRLMSRPARVQVARHGRGLVGEAPEVGHQRAQLPQEAGKLADARLDIGAALGGGLAGCIGLLDEARDPLLLAGERGQRLVGVAREVGEHAVLSREDREHAIRLSKRRIRAVDHLVEVLAAAREPGAELASRIENRSRKGRRMMLFTRSVSTGRARALDRQQALALAVALLDLLSSA